MQPLELQVGQSKATDTLSYRLQIYFPEEDTQRTVWGSRVAGYDPQWPS